MKWNNTTEAIYTVISKSTAIITLCLRPPVSQRPMNNKFYLFTLNKFQSVTKMFKSITPGRQRAPRNTRTSPRPVQHQSSLHRFLEWNLPVKINFSRDVLGPPSNVFSFQQVLISWMVTLSSCLIWQIILPPNEYDCVYAWRTLGNIAALFWKSW